MPTLSFLLAESGGSKTDWRWVSPAGVAAHTGPGLNPSHGAQALAEALAESLGPLRAQAQGAPVVFYGAGLEAEAGRAALRAALAAALAPAHIHLGTDLLAAARCAPGPALVAILGTGSNAARTDGHRLLAQRGGHGWLVGDAGSGVDLGRRLLLALLQGRLPTREGEFAALTGASPLDYRARVYAHARPALQLAALVPLVVAWRHEPEVAALVARAFARFLADDVQPLSSPPAPALVSIGGVAQALAPEWARACAEVGLPAPTFVTHVADALVAYHRQHGLAKL